MNLHDSLSNISITDNNICGEVFPPDSHLEVTFQNGKREGEGIVYSRRNIKLANLSFHEDQLEGFCIIFNERGQKIRECVYEKGVKNGWIREYEKRKVVFTGMCRNDVKVSELKEFKGSKDMMEEIKDGKRIGIWKFDGDNYLSGLHYCIEKLRPKNYKPCGKDYTVNINDLPSVPINQLFFKPVNFSWGKHCSFVFFSLLILFKLSLFLILIYYFLTK